MDNIVAGKKIKLLRIEAGIDQAEFARRVKISVNYLCLIECNKKTPSFKTLNKIAQALEVPIGRFFEDDPMASELRELSKRFKVQDMIAFLQKLTD